MPMSDCSNGVRARSQARMEHHFRYGWRTIVVNLAGLFFLCGFALLFGFDGLFRNPWALSVVFFGIFMLILRLVLECRNPREIIIIDDYAHFRWHGRDISIPLFALSVSEDNAFSMLLDFIKINWEDGSFLVFSHISHFRSLKEAIKRATI